MFVITKEKFSSIAEAEIASYCGRYETLKLNQAEDMVTAIEKAEAIVRAQPLFSEDRVVVYKKSGSELTKVTHEKLMTFYMDNQLGDVTYCKHLVTNSQVSSVLQ